MKSIKNMYLESIMMPRGKKKVHLVNRITHLIESSLIEPCGAIMIDGGQGILIIECKYYDSLRMFTIITDKDGVIVSIDCELNDDLKKKLFGDFDMLKSIQDTFIGWQVISGYNGGGKMINFNPSYYNKNTDGNVTKFVPEVDMYDSILEVFNY